MGPGCEEREQAVCFFGVDADADRAGIQGCSKQFRRLGVDDRCKLLLRLATNMSEAIADPNRFGWLNTTGRPTRLDSQPGTLRTLFFLAGRDLSTSTESLLPRDRALHPTNHANSGSGS